MAGGQKLRLAMAQINVVVGDLEGNARKIVSWMARARDLGADLVTFPELAVTGYPPEDLLLKPAFVDANVEALEAVAVEVKDCIAVVGFVDRKDDIYNAAAVLKDGCVAGVYHKKYLPNYGVFDEFRYFHVGTESTLIEIDDVRIGVTICEDIWYPDGPAVEQSMDAGAEVILNISSSPYHAGKRSWRERMLATRAADATAIVAYNNLVGGQDELVFDGAHVGEHARRCVDRRQPGLRPERGPFRARGSVRRRSARGGSRPGRGISNPASGSSSPSTQS